MGATLTVDRVRPEDWRDLKAVRLAALAESPEAFLTTLADAEARTDEEWQRQAVELVTFLARVGGQPAGMVGAHRLAHDPATVEVVAMWSAPEHRRQGVGAALVEAAAGWARSIGATRLALWVMRSNDPAAAFYRRIGFVDTDDVHVLDHDPCRSERRMERPL